LKGGRRSALIGWQILISQMKLGELCPFLYHVSVWAWLLGIPSSVGIRLERVPELEDVSRFSEKISEPLTPILMELSRTFPSPIVHRECKA